MPMPALEAALAADFQHYFGAIPLVVRAPGQVTLLGKHAEADGGLALSAALDKHMVVAVALNTTGQARLYAYEADVTAASSLTQPQLGGKSWVSQLVGIADGFAQAGVPVPGFDCMFGGNLPVGAGSSAAAVASGLAYALNLLTNAGLDCLTLARLAQQAHQPGTRHGLTDYVTSLCSRPGHLVRLDCDLMQAEYVPFATDAYRIVMLDAGISRTQAAAGYAVRQQECAQGLAVLRRHLPGLRKLREATPMQLHRYRQEMGENVYRRCAFVLAENHRVELAGHHLVLGHTHAFGRQLYASHAGLRHQYAVSCPELDELVHIAHDFPAVLGARMLGGAGSGVCALVPATEAAAFVRHASAAYERYRGTPLFAYQIGFESGVIQLLEGV